MGLNKYNGLVDVLPCIAVFVSFERSEAIHTRLSSRQTSDCRVALLLAVTLLGLAH